MKDCLENVEFEKSQEHKIDELELEILRLQDLIAKYIIPNQGLTREELTEIEDYINQFNKG